MTWKQVWIELFTETFEGIKSGAEATYYVQGDEAIMPILSKLTAQQASHKPSPQVNSIAAHARHTAYYISLLNAMNRGEEVQPDWEGSWSIQIVGEEQWQTIQADLRAEFEELKDWMEKNFDTVEGDKRIYTLGQLAHAAFHLGSIRQLAMTQ